MLLYVPVYIPIHVFVILYKSNELNKRAAQNKHTLTSSASNGIKMYVIDLPKPVGSNAKTSFFSKILNKTLCCSSFNLISNLNFVKTFANVLLYISSIVEERCKHDLIWAYANKHLNWQPEIQLQYSKDGAQYESRNRTGEKLCISVGYRQLNCELRLVNKYTQSIISIIIFYFT